MKEENLIRQQQTSYKCFEQKKIKSNKTLKIKAYTSTIHVLQV